MSWNRIALCISDVLGVILALRLLSLRLHRVYSVFCAYLIYGLLCSSVFFLQAFTKALDYRITYLMIAVGTWVLTLWMVYALLEAILGRLPGILRFSRRLLVLIFALATVLAFLSARSELRATQSSYAIWSLTFDVVLVNVIERVVTTVSLLAVLAIQAFVLWFPVQLPRNLVFFTLGFSFNFVCEITLLAIRWAFPASAPVIDPTNLFVLSACFAYFSFVITRSGESIPLTIGHRWHRSEQERLVHQLEQINLALLKGLRN